jgi:hypothetical protein
MTQSTKQMAYLFRHVSRRNRSLNQLLHRPIRLPNRIAMIARTCCEYVASIFQNSTSCGSCGGARVRYLGYGANPGILAGMPRVCAGGNLWLPEKGFKDRVRPRCELDYGVVSPSANCFRGHDPDTCVFLTSGLYLTLKPRRYKVSAADRTAYPSRWAARVLSFSTR